MIMKKPILMILFLYTFSFAKVYYFDNGEKVYLNKLRETRGFNSENISYYENQMGQKVGVKQEIIIKCKAIDSCQNIFKKYNIQNIKQITSSIFLLSVKNSELFELSQKLYVEKDITISHPNFIKEYRLR